MPNGHGVSLVKANSAGTPEQISCRVYRDPSDPRAELFRAINFPDGAGAGGAAFGRSLIIPHGVDFSASDVTGLRNSAQMMSHGAPVLNQGQIGVYNSSWDLMDIASRFDGKRFVPSGLDIATGVGGAYTDAVQNSLLNIQKNLRAIEKLYAVNVPVGIGKNTARIALMDPAFRATRASHEAAIRNSMTLINRDLVFGRASGNNMRNALGLGKSSVSVQAAKGSDFFGKLRGADGRVSNLLGNTKIVSNGLVAINLGTIGYDTYASYRQGGVEAGAKTLAIKSAGTAAGMKTGAVVAAIVFGAGTGGLGYIALGIAAVVVSSYAASKVTEVAVEKTIDVTNQKIEKLIWAD